MSRAISSHMDLKFIYTKVGLFDLILTHLNTVCIFGAW